MNNEKKKIIAVLISQLDDRGLCTPVARFECLF
jgi:hypothetical protein